ncbi:tetrahydrofolate dehydrogenase/cyclohydrolase catalytic domain-containing protein, partial [Acinetobacter baumannii]
MKSWTHRLPVETTEAQLLAMIDGLNRNPEVHGVLVQLPLPKHIDSQTIIAAINPDKDVDGFHPVNVGRLYTGMPCLVPCT